MASHLAAAVRVAADDFAVWAPLHDHRLSPEGRCTCIEITVDVEVGNVLGAAGCVAVRSLDESGQTFAEESLPKVHILRHIREFPIQAKFALHSHGVIIIGASTT